MAESVLVTSRWRHHDDVTLCRSLCAPGPWEAAKQISSKSIKRFSSYGRKGLDDVMMTSSRWRHNLSLIVCPGPREAAEKISSRSIKRFSRYGPKCVDDVTMTSSRWRYTLSLILCPRTTGCCKTNFVEIDQTVLELWQKGFRWRHDDVITMTSHFVAHSVPPDNGKLQKKIRRDWSNGSRVMAESVSTKSGALFTFL